MPACRSRWFISSVIIGATTPAQLAENLAAFRHDLSPDAIAAINAIHMEMPNPSLQD